MKTEVVESLFTLYVTSKEVDNLQDEFKILNHVNSLARLFNVEDELLVSMDKERNKIMNNEKAINDNDLIRYLRDNLTVEQEIVERCHDMGYDGKYLSTNIYLGDSFITSSSRDLD